MLHYRGRTLTGSCLSRVPFKLSAPLRADRKLSSEGKLPKSRQILSPLNLRYRLQTPAIAGVTCFTFVAWMSPILAEEVRGQEIRGQEFREQEFRGEGAKLEQMYLARATSTDSSAASPEAITTKEVDIPIDELKLLLSPLTLAQLGVEAEAWLGLLQAKVREISDAEIAIKRKNRQLQKEEEAVRALEEAKAKLEEAEEVQKSATEGSPEYEEAGQKVREAKEALEKAQAAVGEASLAKEKIEDDESVKKAVEAAEEKKEEAEAGSEGAEKEEAATDEYNETEEAEAIEEAAEEVEAAVAGLEEGEGIDAAPSAEAVTQKKQELEEAAEKLEEAAEEEEEIKTKLVVNVTALQEEQTAIVDRLNAVLEELENKGGNSESYQKYIQAISGVEIDATDTEGLGVRLVGWLESEEGGQRWAGNIGKFLAIVVVASIVSKLLGAYLNRAIAKWGGSSEMMRHFLVNLVERGGIALGFLVGLTALEVSLGPVIALLGGASFVLAFALQSNLSNFASGLAILFYKPFDVGDEVKLGGIWGWVDSITLANTKVKGFLGETISIPNNTVWESTIENLTAGETRKGVTSVRVPLSENTAKVEEVLLEIAKSNEFILQENPGPRTSVSDYGDYYVKINLSYTAKTSDYWNAWALMMRAVKPGLEKEGISMAVPLQDIRIQLPLNNSKGIQSVADSSSSIQSPSHSSTSASLVPAFGDDSEPYEDADDTPYEDANEKT